VLEYLPICWLQGVRGEPVRTQREERRARGRAPGGGAVGTSHVDAITGSGKAASSSTSRCGRFGCAAASRSNNAWTALPAHGRSDRGIKQTETNQPVRGSPDLVLGRGPVLPHRPTAVESRVYRISLMAYQFNGSAEAGDSPPLVEREPFFTWFRRCQRLARTSQARRMCSPIACSSSGRTLRIVVNTRTSATGRLTPTNRWTESRDILSSGAAWADHPIVIFNSAALRREQLDAARDGCVSWRR